MKYLLLFDIDGTILKMKPGVTLKLINQIISELTIKKQSISELPPISGWTDIQIIKQFCLNFGYNYQYIEKHLEIIWEKAYHIYKPFSTQDYIDILPGVRSLLTSLNDSRQIALGLITGNFRRNAYLKLHAYDLDNLFPFGAFGDDHEDRNHLPIIAIERANQEIGYQCYDNSNTLIIGDTCKDIESAQVNNIPVICVATGSDSLSSLSAMKPNAILNSFEDVNLALNTFYSIINNNK
jgi:phosphoglycolate phosphatase-like HAD superfamily hydrolase